MHTLSPSLITKNSRSSSTQILHALRTHRLHPALLLMTTHEVPASTVLELTWSALEDLYTAIETPSDAKWQFSQDLRQLLHWHACRQRLDRLRAGPSWQSSQHAFVNQVGHNYNIAQADQVVATTALAMQLPIASMQEFQLSAQ